MQRGVVSPAALVRRVAPTPRAVSAQILGSVRVATALAGLVTAAGALAVAAGPARSTTYAGRSAVGAAFTLTAGASLIAAGLVFSMSRRLGRTADLALAAAVCWFAPVWVGWQDGPPLIPSVAMLAAGFTFPLLAGLVLAHPAGAAGSKPAGALISAIYAEALVTATALALFRDPYLDPACLANCTVNSFLVRPLPSLARAVQVTDRWFTVTAALALIAVCAVRLARASRPARRRLLPVYVPGIGFAVVVIARAAELQGSGVEDPFNTTLFTIFAAGSVAVTVLAVGLISGVTRSLAERRAVARIAASLDEAPPPGSLQSALAGALRDRDLQIAYWLPGAQSYIDATGQPVPDPSAASSRPVTHLTRNGLTIAAVSHSDAVHSIESQIGPAIRLGLENERLQAELLAQLDELRTSRARIVETADAERRGLERNLHDGAQQRLLALSYEIRLACAAAQEDQDVVTEAALAGAAADAQMVLGELRDLAHGIYPAVLAEAGIGPALATLADTAALPVELLQIENDRYSEPVEAAIYFAVAEALSDATRRGAGHVTVTVTQDGGQLIVTIEDNEASAPGPLVAASDRVGALGGSLSTGPGAVRVEIPCAS